jgi:hypothetical protein
MRVAIDGTKDCAKRSVAELFSYIITIHIQGTRVSKFCAIISIGMGRNMMEVPSGCENVRCYDD